MDRIEQYRNELRDWVTRMPQSLLTDLLIFKQVVGDREFWGTISFEYQKGKIVSIRTQTVKKPAEILTEKYHLGEE